MGSPLFRPMGFSDTSNRSSRRCDSVGLTRITAVSMWNSASNDGQLVKHRHFTNYFGPDAPFQVVDLNSNPHAIPLFQSCDDPPRKVLAFVLAAMSVKVHDLSPTTELHIHTAFSSALACELRRRPLLRIIYRVDTHWRFTSTYPTMLRVIILPPRASSQAGS